MKFEFDTRMLDERRFVDFQCSFKQAPFQTPPHCSLAELYNWTDTHNYTQISSVHIQN